MTRDIAIPPAKADGTESSRFNAVKHGVLSRYTVLPWEDADDYAALAASLAADHPAQRLGELLPWKWKPVQR